MNRDRVYKNENGSASIWVDRRHKRFDIICHNQEALVKHISDHFTEKYNMGVTKREETRQSTLGPETRLRITFPLDKHPISPRSDRFHLLDDEEMIKAVKKYNAVKESIMDEIESIIIKHGFERIKDPAEQAKGHSIS